MFKIEEVINFNNTLREQKIKLIDQNKELK